MARKNYNKKKYKAVKFAGDDIYSWAVFRTDDIQGLRSPISEYTKAKPVSTGMNMRTARDLANELNDKSLIKVKCIKAWSYQPSLHLDEEYLVVNEYFDNGENHYTLKNKHGHEFDAPCVFLEEINVMQKV